MIKRLKLIYLKNKNIIYNIFGAFVIKGGSLVISILLLPAYLAFFENQVVLGIWYTLLSVMSWVNLFDLGLGQGLRNQLPSAIEANDKNAIQKCVSTTYILMSIVAILVTIFGLLLIPNINWNSILNVSNDIISHRVMTICIVIVFCGIMLQLVWKIVISILYAYQKSAIVNVLGLSSNVIILLLISVISSKDISTNLISMSIVNVVAMNLPYIICTIFVSYTILKDSKPKLSAFSKKYIKNIVNVGISLLWLQLVFMVISSANEFLIANFTSPEYVVEYQAYFKIFKTAAMIVSLALTPIWSAVTRAKAQHNYKWIINIYKIFIVIAGVCFVLELCIIPFLQIVFNLWLGENIIVANQGFAFIFVLSSAIFVLHNVNTSIGNGLSYYKCQMVGMTFAAIFFVPLAYVFVQMTGSWIGVIIANIIVLLPYEILAPKYTMKFINGNEGND